MDTDPVEVDGPSPVTRRDVIKKAALVGGTLVWAAPIVQSIAIPSAWAAASPPPCPISITGSMEGNMAVTPGNELQGGYHFGMTGNHPATTVHVTSAVVTLHAKCDIGGTLFDIAIPLPDYKVTIPANSHDQFPAASQSDPLNWQGTLTAPTGPCGGGAYHVTSATFTANVSISPPSTQVGFQFHYRNHTFNINGGSWSGTKAACT